MFLLLSNKMAMAHSLGDKPMGLPYPNEYHTYQGGSGTCYAYAATDFLNIVLGQIGQKRFRPLSSLLVLSLNEASPFMDEWSGLQYDLRAYAIFEGGSPELLVMYYSKNPESLIPVSDKFEFLLANAIPFSTAPNFGINGNDSLRIRNIISKKMYKVMTKALKSSSLINEAELYLEELKRIGLTMDATQKKIVYSKPILSTTMLVEKIKEKNFSDIQLMTFGQNECVANASQIIYQSILKGYPVLLTSKLISEESHALIIHKISPAGENDFRVDIKNSWKGKMGFSATLSSLCSPRTQSSISYSAELFD